MKLIYLVVLLIPIEAVLDFYFFGQYSGFGITDYLIRCSVESFIFILGYLVGRMHE